MPVRGECLDDVNGSHTSPTRPHPTALPRHGRGQSRWFVLYNHTSFENEGDCTHQRHNSLDRLLLLRGRESEVRCGAGGGGVHSRLARALDLLQKARQLALVASIRGGPN